MIVDKHNNCTVWVGGSEMNDYGLSLDRAKEVALEFIEDGYDDVVRSQETNYRMNNNKWEEL